jgi:ubiquinol-cytochrome c reductase cytochrome b subunit
VTPAHIVPEWYFLPFYAILRAVPDKLGGALLMFGAIGVLFVLPWLDTSKVKSLRYRPTARVFFFLFVLTCLVLGWCGGELPDNMVFQVGSTASGDPIGLNFVLLSRIAAAYYFAYFLIVMPVLGLVETPDPVPDSITASILNHSAEKKG